MVKAKEDTKATDEVAVPATTRRKATPKVAEAEPKVEVDAAAEEPSGHVNGDKPAAAKKASAPAKRPPAAPKSPKGGYFSDQKFIEHQVKALHEERATYVEQAKSLRAEADSLVEEMEPGDVQFDEESGEGGTVTVDRERDLALSAQALSAVEEIDHALVKLSHGSYGVCEGCGSLIPKNRLEALPAARLCIACKSGGLSRH